MSKIEVNTVDVQCGSNLTVGSSGKTVSLATGASQTGFGRTGTVDWCTTAKTSPFTATSGDGFFLNTNGGAITVTLPSSPSQGDIVAFKDYNNTWDDACKAVTLGRNGSKINGVCEDAILNTQSQSVTLIYVDGTKGWQDIHDSTSNVTGNPAFINATGGTVTTSGDFKIHTFTGDGNFIVTAGTTAPNNNVSYMVVAGGGGGGYATSNAAGGGGGGGFREGETPQAPFTGSPLKACTGLPVSSQSYPITVGGGGAGGASAPQDGTNGVNSIFSSITSAGGGGGGRHVEVGLPGGSGGGGGGGASAGKAGGNGNTPPVSPPQGQNGGTGGSPSPDQASAGGGGATAAGTNGANPSSGAGGAGATTSISGSPLSFSGGGGGGDAPGGGPGAGGTGGGGAGGVASAGVAGTVNTGGGAGGGSNTNAGGAGGSGKVVIKYKFQ